jgi:hypothetical protein
MLPSAARLLNREEVELMLERVRPLPSIPLNDAHRVEAVALLSGDADRAREAADLYRTVEMPYEEARCLAAAGDAEAAVAIFERLDVPPAAV